MTPNPQLLPCLTFLYIPHDKWHCDIKILRTVWFPTVTACRILIPHGFKTIAEKIAASHDPSYIDCKHTADIVWVVFFSLFLFHVPSPLSTLQHYVHHPQFFFFFPFIVAFFLLHHFLFNYLDKNPKFISKFSSLYCTIFFIICESRLKKLHLVGLLL